MTEKLNEGNAKKIESKIVSNKEVLKSKLMLLPIQLVHMRIYLYLLQLPPNDTKSDSRLKPQWNFFL